MSTRADVERLAGKLAGLGPAGHGFAHVDLDRARRRADELDRLPPRHRGRLSGWLVPAKDLTPVAGLPLTYGNAARLIYPERTAEPIRLLERAGAIVPGSTAASELGLSSYCEPVGMPAPDNPVLPGRTPGGSSGGAAVAIARGLVRAAHGTDGGGSLRVPAAACGLVGFKPAHRARRGRLAASGVITRTVADQALVHGLEPARPGRVRVGVLTEPLFGRRAAGPRWAEAARRAAALLEEAGVPTMPVRPHPDAAGFFAVFRVLVLAGADAAAPGTSPLVAYLARLGEGLDRRAFARAARAQQQILPAARRFWPVDALLTPTLAFDPPELGAFSRLSPEEDFLAQTDWTPWGSLANLTGAPAISVPMPAGDGQRLPPSIQLIGLNLGDSRLLGLAGLLAA